MPQRDLVFFSYNHKDARWLELIDSALKPYVLYEKLSVWSDLDIKPGDEWNQAIQRALMRTRVAVLFVSQLFFSSKFIRENELPQLIRDAEQGLLILICVPVGAVDARLLSQSQLDKYQFIFPSGQPLSAFEGHQREEAVVKVAVCVEQAYSLKESAQEHTISAPIAHEEGASLGSTAPTEGLHVAPLVGVPQLDERYVDRPRALARLKELVLHGENLAAGITSTNRAGRVGLHGMGGMGKTVLAQAFCHDDEVRRTFPDGIYWLTLGQEPTLLALQTELLQMLNKDLPTLESISQARRLLWERVQGKRVLLVIDDLWQAEHFQPFDIATGKSRVLITTRDASLLTAIGAAEEVLDRLDEDQAQRLIAEWARVDVAKLPALSVRVAELCGNLPLALALAGAQVAGGLKWETLVKELEDGKIRFLDHPYGSVFNSLGRSVDALSEVERERYLELAVFPEDARIPPETIARLWKYSGGLSESETEKLLNEFHRKALLKKLKTGGPLFITFHDLQRDFVRIRADDPQILSGLLLDAYRATLKLPNNATAWAHLPKDEPYLWNRLAFHLVEAERQEELRALLLSMAWIGAKLNAGTAVHAGRTSADVNALLSDYDHLADVPEVALVQRALRMSMHVIGPHPEQAAFQMFGRLATSDTSSILQLCREALAQGDKAALAPLRPALNPPGPLALTLAGHEEAVKGATLLADGRHALSWSADATLRVWDLERGEALHTLTGHEDMVTGATLLADGRRALSWSADATLRVWDLERGEALHTLTGHEDMVTGATLLADGRRALSWSTDGTLRVWDLERGEALHTLTGHEGPVYGVTLLAEERRALSWSADATLRVWDLERGETLHTITGHESRVLGATLLANGRRALSWSENRTLRVWDLERGEALHTLISHEGSVDGATLLAEGWRALSWAGRTLRMWDLERGEALHTLTGHQSSVHGATLLAEGRCALSWSEDRTLRVWDLERGEALHTLRGHADRVSGAMLLAKGRRALSWSADATLRVWDLERVEALHTLTGHEGHVYGATLLANGRRALSWSEDRTLRVWDLERGEALHTLRGHAGRVSGATLLAKGRRALSWSADGTLRVWDLERVEALYTLTGHQSPVYRVTLLAEGQRALSWAERTLRVWDLERGEALHTLTGHERQVYGVTLLAEGQRALSWSADGTLRVWDLERGEALHTLTGHESSVWAATLLAEGRRALSRSADATLRVWDLERSKALHALHGHEGRIYGVTLLAEGRRALSWSYDRTLRLWDLERGVLLCNYFADGVLYQHAIDEQHGRIFVSDALGRIHIIRLNNNQWDPQ